MANREIVTAGTVGGNVNLVYTQGDGGNVPLRMDGYYTGPQFQLSTSGMEGVPEHWRGSVVGLNIFPVSGGAITVFFNGQYYHVPEGASYDIWWPAHPEGNSPWEYLDIPAAPGSSGRLVLATFYLSRPLGHGDVT